MALHRLCVPHRLGTALFSRIRDESGFTIVEAVVSVMILAVGGFAVAQAMTFGLETSGASRERLAARAGAEQQMELARALNYDNLVLSDSVPIPHDNDPEHPDYWVDETAETYDRDGSGPAAPERIVRVAGASPALQHLQNPYVQGNTEYAVYMYVTWVDAPDDGLGVSDSADGNGDGVSDSDGQDAKRVTVVISWTEGLQGATKLLSFGSLFSDQKVPYHEAGGSAPNQPPTVSCPTTSVSELSVTFAASASDSDGTIAQIDWDFGDGEALVDGGANPPAHTYASVGTYDVSNTVYDNQGASSSNSDLSCTVTVTSGGSGSGPEGSVVIAGGATYTTTTQVTLQLSSAEASKMQFSDDGETWGPLLTYSTSSIYTVPDGDGIKTVYARFENSSGQVGPVTSDTIILDQTPGGPPTNLSATSSTSGSTKNVVLSWTAPFPAPSDLAGYLVFRRKTTTTTWTQVSCSGSGTTCNDSFKKQDSYEYYVVAIDNAGNQSDHSNHITV
jgi:type II secretory pathway pseudopilin PulG